ncbi:unnamed protein product [Camellia sinensis]
MPPLGTPLPRRHHSHHWEHHPLPNTPTESTPAATPTVGNTTHCRIHPLPTEKHPCCNTHCPGTPTAETHPPQAFFSLTPKTHTYASAAKLHRPTPIGKLDKNNTQLHPSNSPSRRSARVPTGQNCITYNTLVSAQKRTPQTPTLQKRSNEIPGCP